MPEFIIIFIILLIIFGAGEISEISSNIAKGIEDLKKGLKEKAGRDKNTERLSKIKGFQAHIKIISRSPISLMRLFFGL